MKKMKNKDENRRKRGRPPGKRALTKEDPVIGKLTGRAFYCVKAWDMYMDGKTLFEISKKYKMTTTTVARVLKDRADELRVVYSPEGRTMATEKLMCRYEALYQHAVDQMRADDGKFGPAWAAIALKTCELMGKLHGLGGAVLEVSDGQMTGRLEALRGRLDSFLSPNSVVKNTRQQRHAYREDALKLADCVVVPSQKVEIENAD